MKKSKPAIAAIAIILFALLVGCAGGLRSETIIIADEEPTVDQGDKSLEVKTIYRLPMLNEKGIGMVGWGRDDILLQLFWNGEGEQALASFEAPYEKPTLLPNLSKESIANSISPDGRYTVGYRRSDGASEVILTSLADRKEKTIDSFQSVRVGLLNFSWSDNGRYVSYIVQGSETVEIRVNDIESGSTLNWTLPESKPYGYFISARISDDGSGAAITKEENGQTSFLLGSRSGGEFVAEYEHTIESDTQAAWIDPYRFAFVGTDGTLFAYDRRNAELAVLAERVGSFQISSDREYIAYAKGEAVYAAQLKGNNLFNPTVVYQGIVPAHLAWSPHRDKLLLQGRKPYEKSAAMPAAPAEIIVSDVSQSFVIEFQ